MSNRAHWLTAFTSAAGGTAITTKPTLLGGYGGQLISTKTVGSFRLTNSLGGTKMVAFSKHVDGLGGATLYGVKWINLAHPPVFEKGLSISIGAVKSQTMCGMVLYKEL